MRIQTKSEKIRSRALSDMNVTVALASRTEYRYRTRTTKFGRAGRLSSAGVVLIGTANAKRQGQGSSWHLGDYRYRYSRSSVGRLPPSALSLSALCIWAKLFV